VLQHYGIEDPDSYDVHTPLLVQKAKIPTHLKTPQPVSWRSLYGNLCGYPSTIVDTDVKTGAAGLLKRKAATGFVSSSEGTFRRSGIEALLMAKFPVPCRYEREDSVMEIDERAGRHQWRKDRLVRRVTRSGETMVRTEAGWVPESSEVSGGGADRRGAAAPSPDHVCDNCGFAAKSEFGLGAHRRAKHPEVE